MPEDAGNGMAGGVEPAPPAGGRRGKLPVLRFVVLMILLLVGFNALFYGWFSRSRYFDGYLDVNAEATAATIRAFGETDVVVEDQMIKTPRFSLGIKRGCDAIQPAVFFAFFVAASPVLAGFGRKLRAVLIGIALLLFINLFRLVSLYYVGVFKPAAFEWVHIEFWQTVFVALPIVFWLVWVRGQRLKTSVKPDATE